MTDSGPMVCANHPQIETSLRCNQCEKPICTKCAVLTPTGYRCRECVSSRQKVFETAITRDYWLAFPAAAVLSFIGSLFAGRIGLFAILAGPITGTIIAEVVRFITQKRRSKKLFRVATIGVIAGCMPAALSSLFSMAGTYSVISLVYLGIFAGLAASTLYYRLAGISI